MARESMGPLIDPDDQFSVISCRFKERGALELATGN